MKPRLFLVVVAAVLMFAASSTVTFAHHGGAAFDQTQSVTMQGTMTEMQFANPHVLLFFDVKNAKGETENWSGWLTAPNKLARAGWNRKTLVAGDKVVVTGTPHKSGSHIVQIRKLVGPDGMELPLFEN